MLKKKFNLKSFRLFFRLLLKSTYKSYSIKCFMGFVRLKFESHSNSTFYVLCDYWNWIEFSFILLYTHSTHLIWKTTENNSFLLVSFSVFYFDENIFIREKRGAIVFLGGVIRGFIEWVYQSSFIINRLELKTYRSHSQFTPSTRLFIPSLFALHQQQQPHHRDYHKKGEKILGEEGEIFLFVP